MEPHAAPRGAHVGVVAVRDEVGSADDADALTLNLPRNRAAFERRDVTRGVSGDRWREVQGRESRDSACHAPDAIELAVTRQVMPIA